MEIPEWFNRINYMGSGAGGPASMISLDANDLVATAIRDTGLSDFGDEGWRKIFEDWMQLGGLVDRLHTMGRLIIRAKALRVLKARLLLIDEIKKDPKIEFESIKQPIFVVGNPRSGTSILFEILAQDQRLRAPLTWQVYFPESCSPESGLDYVRLTQGASDLLMDINPAVRSMHETSWNMPVECYELMDVAFLNFHRVKNYGQWLDKFSESESYEWHRRFLQFIQAKSPGGNWLLKTPYHLHFLDRVFAIYPDAKVLFIHRDPGKFMASYFHLLETSSRTLFSPGDFDHGFQLSLWEQGLRKVISERKRGAINGLAIADIHFINLMADPVGTLRSAYAALDLEFTDDFSKRIIDYLSQRKRYKYGKYEYDPRDFNIDSEAIREQFKFYIEHYGIKIEY